MCSRVRSFDRFFVVSVKHLEKTASARATTKTPGNSGHRSLAAA